ncbi:unnamed protein product [marine sediment metagenome]|uniref:Uncharacterized protein n=1 Tax=marine sediment metagenome TaxID=412755 RepID=X1AYZ9_9ZZZZ
MTRRNRTMYLYDCHAPPEAIDRDWHNMPGRIKNTILEMSGLRCDGGGVPGPWCESCKWGKTDIEQNVDDVIF